MVTSVIIIINSVIIIINFRTIRVGVEGAHDDSFHVGEVPRHSWFLSVPSLTGPQGRKSNMIFILINLEGEIRNAQPAPFLILPLGSKPVCKEHAQ